MACSNNTLIRNFYWISLRFSILKSMIRILIQVIMKLEKTFYFNFRVKQFMLKSFRKHKIIKSAGF